MPSIIIEIGVVIIAVIAVALCWGAIICFAQTMKENTGKKHLARTIILLALVFWFASGFFGRCMLKYPQSEPVLKSYGGMEWNSRDEIVADLLILVGPINLCVGFLNYFDYSKPHDIPFGLAL